MNKASLLEIIAKDNFLVQESAYFDDKFIDKRFVFTWNEETEKGILIREYISNDELSKLDEEVHLVRDLLRKKEYNIWNIYYFILLNLENNPAKKLYNLERDSRNMRKYVILSSQDLLRVPFLNTQNKENSFESLDFWSLFENTGDIEIDKFIQRVIEDEGEYKKLSNQKIRKVLTDTISKGDYL